MLSKKNTNITLLAISIFVLFVFAAAFAQPPTTAEETNPPSGPCDDCEIDTQSIPGEVNENSALGLNWITSMPVSINPGETKEIQLDGGVALFGWTLQSTGGTGVSLNLSETDERINSITAECSATGSYQIKVQDSKGRQIEDSITVNSSTFAFDYSQLNDSDEQVARNSSIVIYVKNGVPPYTWTIANTSFYFIDNGQQVQQIETDVPSVTLYTKSTSCGNIGINITDGCGKTTNGEVRTYGKWVVVTPNGALITGRWQRSQMVGGTGAYFLTVGKYQVRQRTLQTPFGNGSPECNAGQELTGCPPEVACINALEVKCSDYWELSSYGTWPHCYLNDGRYINERCNPDLITSEWTCR